MSVLFDCLVWHVWRMFRNCIKNLHLSMKVCLVWLSCLKCLANVSQVSVKHPVLFSACLSCLTVLFDMFGECFANFGETNPVLRGMLRTFCVIFHLVQVIHHDFQCAALLKFQEIVNKYSENPPKGGSNKTGAQKRSHKVQERPQRLVWRSHPGATPARTSCLNAPNFLKPPREDLAGTAVLLWDPQYYSCISCRITPQTSRNTTDMHNKSKNIIQILKNTEITLLT